MISSRTRSFDSRSSAVCQSVMMQIVSAIVDLGQRGVADVEPVAFVEQVGDLVHHAQDGLAPDLGRVGGDHRAHAELADDLGDQLGGHAGSRDPFERRREAAGPRRACRRRGDGGDAVRDGRPRRCWRAARASRRRGSRGAVRRSGGRPAGPRGRRPRWCDSGAASTAPAADLFDQFERRRACLAADDVAEEPPEQPDVVAQLVVGGDVRRGVGHGHALSQVDFPGSCSEGGVLAAWRHASRRSARLVGCGSSSSQRKLSPVATVGGLAFAAVGPRRRTPPARRRRRGRDARLRRHPSRRRDVVHDRRARLGRRGDAPDRDASRGRSVAPRLGAGDGTCASVPPAERARVARQPRTVLPFRRGGGRVRPRRPARRVAPQRLAHRHGARRARRSAAERAVDPQPRLSGDDRRIVVGPPRPAFVALRMVGRHEPAVRWDRPRRPGGRRVAALRLGDHDTGGWVRSRRTVAGPWRGARRAS